ncbi:grhN [Rhodococcus tibetensis]|uniref:GrhN n=1 Tax=Rhodococcus tibetensis TaxID=2965064 RepID=A0ABT1Q9J1_9NOCA|nr:grhN [Rhodococcus sp. FXJ9.536]MCQ4117835.1 grhN [Rhodococcus sp. FXJ9.536]
MSKPDTANVRLSPPSPQLMRLVNPLVRRALTTRSWGRRIRRQGLIEFTGRRTGRIMRVPVCLHDVDGGTLIFTERPWRFNFAGGAPVTVTHRGRVRRGRALLLDATPAEAGAAFRAALDDGASPFELGLKVPRGYVPTEAELAEIARSLIRVDYDD